MQRLNRLPLLSKDPFRRPLYRCPTVPVRPAARSPLGEFPKTNGAVTRTIKPTIKIPTPNNKCALELNWPRDRHTQRRAVRGFELTTTIFTGQCQLWAENECLPILGRTLSAVTPAITHRKYCFGLYFALFLSLPRFHVVFKGLQSCTQKKVLFVQVGPARDIAPGKGSYLSRTGTRCQFDSKHSRIKARRSKA